MKTKERILQVALELFNEFGIKGVTLRRIAQASAMSQGNLNYHFKTKSELISALYFNLISEMNVEMQKITQDQPVISFLFKSSLVSMQILYRYKFITQDLFSVLASNAELKAHYLELQKIRKQQFLVMFENLINDGLLRAEEIENEYERLYERMQILGDNWMNTADLFAKKHPENITYYHGLLIEVIYPYLTSRGKAKFLKETG